MGLYKDGVLVEFFGHPAGTLRSLAVIALSTGAPVVPAAIPQRSMTASRNGF